MNYRDIRQEDVEKIANLCQAEGWKTYDRELVERLIEKSNWLVAEHDGQILAFARYLTDGALTIYLCEILVDPSMRQKGLGRQMIQEIFSQYPGLRMDLLSDNDEFYTKLHFRDLGKAFRAYDAEVREIQGK